MWKFVSTLQRSALGGFRASLREDGQRGAAGQTHHRVLHVVGSNQSGSSGFSSLGGRSSPASAGSFPKLLQGANNGVVNKADLHPFRLNHTGYDGCGGGWNLVEALNYSTALVLTYNLVHQQRENSLLAELCSWRALKKSRGALAQPLEPPEPSRAPLWSEANLPEEPHPSFVEVEKLVTNKLEGIAIEDRLKPAKEGTDLKEKESQHDCAAVDPAKEFEIELDSLDGVHLLQVGDIRGIRMLRAQSRRGSSVASFYLGMAYENGHLVARNLATARKYYARSARAGNPEAKFNLAVFYAKGLGGLKVDAGRARSLLREAAEAGVPSARMALGISESDDGKMDDSTGPVHGRELYLMGQSFEALGELEAALEMYGLAVKAGYRRAAPAEQRLNSGGGGSCDSRSASATS